VAPAGPMMMRVQFGREMRLLREAARLTLDAAAEQLRQQYGRRCTPSRLSRIEQGQIGGMLKEPEVRELADIYAVNDEVKISQLIELRRACNGTDWWDRYADVLPSGLTSLLGWEQIARSERAFEALFVPSVFQTEQYMRALYAADRSHSGDAVDQIIEMKLERIKLLFERDGGPMEFWAIVDEAALRRPVGGRDVMRTQLQHLTSCADEMPHVTLQIMPYAAGAHIGMSGAFALLDIEDRGALVYIDSAAGNLYLEKPKDVRTYTSRYDRLRAVAPGPDDSLQLLNTIMRET
jgi:transcriptional regulator with XRE-family HTH domain